jgi:hypothetical protein
MPATITNAYHSGNRGVVSATIISEFLGSAIVPVAALGVPPNALPLSGEHMRPRMSRSAPPPAASSFFKLIA